MSHDQLQKHENLVAIVKHEEFFKKTLCDNSNQCMAKVMHIILLKVTKVAFVTTIFLVVNVNEVIMINNTQWISITLYMVQAWKRIPIFFFVETIHISDTSNNIFFLMLKCLDEFASLRLEELGGKLVSVGCDGNNVF